MFFWLGLVLSSAPPCHLKTNTSATGLSAEYTSLVQTSNRLLFDNTTTLHTRDFAIGDLQIIGTPSYENAQAIRNAYQYILMLFVVKTPFVDPRPGFVVYTNTTPHSDPNVIGLWNPSGDIELYLDRIGNPDLVFAVTLHEMFHHLAFNSLDYGAGSFSSKVHPVTKEYTGTNVRLFDKKYIYIQREGVCTSINIYLLGFWHILKMFYF